MTSPATCLGCGSQLPDSGKFCVRCGHEVGAVLRFGDYEVKELLGIGGMGRVFRAAQPRLKREVCVKTLLPWFNERPDVVARFEREALTMAQLKHPNVVAVHDVGRHHGQPYFVMELVPGRQLRTIIKTEAPLAPARAQVLIDQVLSALSEAHANGIVHRDLKPANVLVTSLNDGTEVCKVLDFGIARAVDQGANTRLTHLGHMVGTPGYMAPEQLSPDHDHRVDLYAAGVMLFEALCGSRPFLAKSEVDLLQKLISEEAPLLSSRLPTAQPFDEVCAKALARAPDARFQTAQAFREALARVVGKTLEPSEPEGVALGAEPDSPSYSLIGTLSTSSPASVLAAVLASSREQQRRLEALRGAFSSLLAHRDAEGLRTLLRSLKAAATDDENEAGARQVLLVFREQVLAGLSHVLALYFTPASQVVGETLLKLGGPALAAPLRENLAAATEASARGRLFDALRLVLPSSEALVDTLATEPSLLEALLRHHAAVADDAAVELFSVALTSPLAALRKLALGNIDDRLAPGLLEALRARLHDPDPSLRAEALAWVRRLGDVGAVKDLERLAARQTLTGDERAKVQQVLGAVRSPGK